MLFSLVRSFGTLKDVRKIVFYLLLSLNFFFFVHSDAFAEATIPGDLTGVCSTAGGNSPLFAGDTCAYSGYSAAIKSKIVCITYGPDINTGKYDSVCCDTQTQCDKVVGASTETANTCSRLPNSAKNDCETCMNDNKHVWTAIGCIETTTTGLINKFLPLGIGMAGGIAFLLIIFGAFQMMMSSGNPEKLNAGKELVSAAITGLLLIIFSIFILQLVGAQILAIPGFK